MAKKFKSFIIDEKSNKDSIFDTRNNIILFDNEFNI